MFKTSLNLVVFLAGLIAVCWIGAGYIGSNPTGAAVALLIAVCYSAGGLELLRYRQATQSLRVAAGTAPSAGATLGDWLTCLHPSLRNAVRLRVEGERVALPGPVLTPYLVGLLVLLGMLGTLLGMMATLRGTGLALDSATDLQSIRGSLGAPVEGLAVAFGTSIAGVASSAMLGLLSALCRRERLQAVQLLDVQIATTLHPHSQAHQRAEALALQQQQASLMPALMDRLQAMTLAIEAQNAAANGQLLANQERFHAKADAEQARWVAAMEQSLKESVALSARAVGAALQPIMETTMAGIARETTALQATVGDAVQRQLDALGSGFDASRQAAAATWHDALASQQQTNRTLTTDLRTTLEAFATQHDQRALELLDAVSSRLAATADGWGAAQDQQQQTNAAMTADLRAALDAFATQHGQHAGELLQAMAARLDTTSEHWATAQREQQHSNATLTNELRSALEQFGQRHDQRATELVQAMAARLDASADTAARAWSEALREQDSASQTLAARHQQALDAAAATLQQQAGALLQALGDSHGNLQAGLEARDLQRLATWSSAFNDMAAELGQQWAETSDQVARRQQEICDTLTRTAQAMTAQSQAHASDTITEISRLVQVASEAPKAAADVVAELRQKLSDSMVRDTAMLEERSRLLATLETLLDAVNHASTEQRAAVDGLVSTSSELLERVGSRFTDHIAAETGKLDHVAAQVTASAVEVASLAEVLGSTMDVFGNASTGLGERLEQIANALDSAQTRSDEQLAYYVAQAREVIDLSVLSQKQIIEELQQLTVRKAGA